MFQTILENELRRRGMSLRDAASEIGISHSTLAAAKNGTRRLDLETALAIAKWLDIPLATLVEEADPESQQKKKVYQALGIVLEAAPDLEKVFIDAANELEKGTLSLSDFRDIVEYAAYKIRIRREQIQKNEDNPTEAG